jgi:hypothetical protein
MYARKLDLSCSSLRYFFLGGDGYVSLGNAILKILLTPIIIYLYIISARILFPKEK